MRILVLGVTGMLGNAVLKVFSEPADSCVWGTMRGESSRQFYPQEYQERLISGIDVLDQDALIEVFARVQPQLVINCIGLIKQLAEAKDPLIALPINALLPHRLAKLCVLVGARLIHVSTDCVFSGRRGGYLESDISDAEDLYGKSKYIGELHDLPHAITLRTSIIGHELNSSNALIDWFLGQEGVVNGYSNAIFSGLPTVELAKVMRDFVLPKPNLFGLYHVSAEPISKLELLKLVARYYQKDISIHPDDKLKIDRSLRSDRFTAATGYVAPDWPALITMMHKYH